MSTMKFFNKERLVQLSKHLESSKQTPCDCAQPQVNIFTEIYTLPIKSDNLPSPAIDLAVTRCDSCGKVELIDPRVMD